MNGPHEHENIIEETFSWLRNPNLLENLVHDFGRFGIVGEPGNLVTVLFVYNSRLCEGPLNLSPSGDSGVGKSFLSSQPSEFWGRDAYVTGYMSKTSLIHDTDWAKKDDDGNIVVDLTGKVIVILEAETSREFLDFMKPIRSHDKKEIWFNVTEGEGRKRVKKVCIKGWPVFITISVNPSSKPEDSTRDLNLTPSYSESKGKAVNLHKGKVHEAPWRFPTDNELREMSANWTQALSCLIRLKVVNPFATKLAEIFDTKNPRSMRDFDKVLSLFDSCVLLHQYQRIQLDATNGVRYVIGTIDDLRVTLKIANILLEPTITGLRADVLRAYREFFKSYCPAGAGRTVRQIGEDWYSHYGINIKRTTLLETYLYPLKDAGLLNVDDSEKAHKYEVSSVDVSKSAIIDPDRFLQSIDFDTGLRPQLEGLFASVDVLEVRRGDTPISMASIKNVIQEILSSVQASTIRQKFLDKLDNPLASCMKNEESVCVGKSPTVPDRSDRSSTDLASFDLSAKVEQLHRDFKNNVPREELVERYGMELVEREGIPILGGRDESPS